MGWEFFFVQLWGMEVGVEGGGVVWYGMVWG